MSRVRPGIPLLLRFVSLRKSSKKPMRPKPTVTATSIQTKSLVRFAHSSVETTTAKIIMMPPMVGVPDLDWCVSGPSSRMDCPICSDSSLRMSQGPTTKQMARAVMDA